MDICSAFPASRLRLAVARITIYRSLIGRSWFKRLRFFALGQLYLSLRKDLRITRACARARARARADCTHLWPWRFAYEIQFEIGILLEGTVRSFRSAGLTVTVSYAITSHYLPSRTWIWLSSFHLPSFFHQYLRYVGVVTDIINVLRRILLYCVRFSTSLSTSAIVLSTFVFPSSLCKIHIRIKTPRWRAIFRVGYTGIVFAFSRFPSDVLFYPLLSLPFVRNVLHRGPYALTNFVD